MTRQSCPECRAAGKTGKLGAVFGPHPAGRCDEHHAEHEARKAACVDCLAEGRPPKKCMPVSPKVPGRRCLAHGRAFKRRQSEQAHEARLVSNFEITAEDYWLLYANQGGCCFVCRVATGKTKRLAVDHDHKCTAGHDPKKGCHLCIRALLCGQCNQILGRYGLEKLRRFIEVLTDPPARKVLLDS